jgi:alpha-L-fucosidase
MLVDIASKGGNFLLNVGPTAEGLIPDSSVVRLKQMGLWMQQNSESIYGTSASPFFKLPWGRCTTKKVGNSTLLYLHVFNWPKDGTLLVPGLKTRITDVYLLSNPRQKFAWKFQDDNVLIHAPNVIFDPVNTVVVVKTKGKMEIISNKPVLKNGSVLLPADFANIHNPGYGTHASIRGTGENSVIQNWIDPGVTLDWMFNTSESGKYRIEALIKADNSSQMNIALGDQKTETEIQATNGKFDVVNLGEIEISETGDQTITLSPDRDNWNALELMYVELIKI